MQEFLETVSLLSADKKDELTCHVVASVDLDGERFVLLSPKNTFVTVVRDDEDGVEELSVEDAKVFIDTFNEEIKDRGLSLKVEGGELLLNGELTAEITELCDTLGVGDEEDDDNYYVLADIEKDKAVYLLLTPELPAMFPARIKEGKGHSLSDEELAKVEDALESALQEQLN